MRDRPEKRSWWRWICYLLDHFLVVQVGDDGLYDGRAEDIPRDVGVITPLPVLEAMGRVVVGDELGFDITELDGALQAIYDPPVSVP